MKEPRTSTFSVGQQVEVQHSNTRYDKRLGTVVDKIGGGVYAVDLPARTRIINGPTGHPKERTDPGETKKLKLGSLQRVATVVAAQGTLFSE